MKRLIPLLCLALLPASLLADTVSLGTHGTLTVTVPKGWTLSTQKEEDSGIALTLSPAADVNAKCLVNVAFVPEPKPVVRDEIEDKVKAISEQFVDGSVEKAQNVRAFSLSGGAIGLYCVFTDASLVGKEAKRDEFKVIGVGVIGFNDDVMAAVSMGGQDAKGAAFADMLAAVQSLAVARK